MKIKITLLSFLLISFLFTLFNVKPVFASSYSLSGSVKDNSGTEITGATINVFSPGTNNNVIAPTASDTSGNYSFNSVPQGPYDIKVTPPSGSNFSSAIALNQNISSDTTLNFVLTPADTVVLQGHIYNALGQPLSNQRVLLIPAHGQNITTFTSADGSYSLQASPGQYALDVSATNNALSTNAPQQYEVFAGSYSLTQSVIQDITLPFKKVVVHTKDAAGNPVSNIGITSNLSVGYAGATLASCGLDGLCKSSYDSSAGLTTDSNGDATLWLFATTNQGASYGFNATPPTGSSYTSTGISQVTFLSDTTVSITMQQPVTLSGHIYNALGEPLSNQKVLLIPSSGGQNISTLTSSDGSYSLQASTGQYALDVSATSNALSTDAPQQYEVFADNYTLTQTTTKDITLPFKKVIIHTKNAAGSSVENVGIAINSTFGFSGSGNSSCGLDGFCKSTYNSSADLMTDNNGDVTAWLFSNAGDGGYSYRLTATPENTSNYITTNLSSLNITSDTTVQVTMQEQPVTLSGHIYNSVGDPVSNQKVLLIPTAGGQNISTFTSADGSYSLQASPGQYALDVSGTNNATSTKLPQQYEVYSDGYSLTQDQTEDITLPLKKVTIHIQDAMSNPVSNVGVTANLSVGWAGDGKPSCGLDGLCKSSYDSSGGIATDNNGDATLWLFATTNQGATYGFTAIPSSGSIYSTFNVSNISVTTDVTELISLQYNHATPVTSADLVTIQPDGTTYSDPTTVTLAAQAASGYTIANTYYTVDGGAQQTYSTPFTVTGAGSHTITYWSTDNSGVQETHNSKTFTITESYNLTGTVYVDTNQNGVQDSGEQGYTNATVTLDSGQTVTTDTNGNYSFANVEAGSYVETLTVPSGYLATTTNPVSVPLAANTTENFGIVFPTPTSTPTPTPTATPTPTPTVTPTPLPTNTPTPTPTPVPTSNVTGNVFTDANQNGVKDTGEPNYQGATVTLSGDGGSTTTTDSIGNYSFQNLPSGSYTVTLTLPSGYTATTTNPVTVPLTTNTTVNFGMTPQSPTVGTITVTPNPTHVNSTTTASASFTDPVKTATDTATWNWGDGSAQTTGTVTETNGSGTVTGTHTYTTFGTYTVTLSVTDVYNKTTQKTTSITVVKQLTALSPATVYINKSPLDLLIKFDLKAEVYKDNTLVSSGEVDGVSPKVPATAQAISFNSFSPVDFPVGSALKVVVYARNACSGSIGNSATATLSYNNTNVDSKFGSTIGATAATYHLLNGFVLGTTAGNSTKKVNLTLGAPCSAFQSFGTWTVTP